MIGHRGTGAIRDFNRSLILDLAKNSGRTTRAELAVRSKLTKATVSSIVQQLVEAGMLRELGLDESLSGGGRPARLLEFNGESAAYLGIHFDPGCTEMVVADARGEIRHVSSGSSQREAPVESMARLRTMISDVLLSASVDGTRLQAVCAVVPGMGGQASGACALAPGLDWRDSALREALAEELRVPVVVTNAAQASAVAEGRLGAARGARSFVWLHVGAEVCAGIIADGRPFLGHRGLTGEIGHCPIVDNDLECSCGRRGCLTALVSSIVERGLRELRDANLATLPSTDEPTLAWLATAAESGERFALRSLLEIAECLGRAIACLLNILNPQMVVVGGPLAAGGEVLLRHVRASVARHAVSPHGVPILQTTLPERSEATGAALLATDHGLGAWREVTASPR